MLDKTDKKILAVVILVFAFLFWLCIFLEGHHGECIQIFNHITICIKNSSSGLGFGG